MKQYFSRITLKKDAHVTAIAKLLLPRPSDKQGSVLADRHSLVWSLFAKDKTQKRDFLWREDKYGLFYTLSEGKPKSDLFDIETKSYQPDLETGDLLAFSLRANPVVSRKVNGSRRSVRHDVVMDQLKIYQAENNKNKNGVTLGDIRNQLINKAGGKWMEAQGERNGFSLKSCHVDSYHQHKLPRGGAKDMQFSTLDYGGVLQVEKPDDFLKQLDTGFGAAKGFGCGLMLIRRI